MEAETAASRQNGPAGNGPRSPSAVPRHRVHRWRRVLRAPWFEPVLALLILVALVVSILAYSGTWPPMVVVESWSMEHPPSLPLGTLNTGDIVLIQKVPVPQGVVTYVQGLVTGYQTYGEFGDVILYQPDGDTTLTPIIHRALLWLQYDPAQGAFSAPSLLPLTCGLGGQYVDYPAGGGTRCLNPSNPNETLTGTLVLRSVGYNGVDVKIDMTALAQESPWSGYITLGDNNSGIYDQTQCPPRCLVKPPWVIGVARGLIPWIGALKLWLTDQVDHDNDYYSRMVPAASWYGLAGVIAAIIIVPSAVPWAYRKWRTPRADTGETHPSPPERKGRPEDPPSDPPPP